jgi:hypothetical protein
MPLSETVVLKQDNNLLITAYETVGYEKATTDILIADKNFPFRGQGTEYRLFLVLLFPGLIYCDLRAPELRFAK